MQEFKSTNESIVECIAHNALIHPDRICFADGKTELSYSDAWKNICGMSAKLKTFGLNKGDCVVVECNQSTEYMICEFAIQYAGGVFVPLEKNAPITRIVEIVKDTESKLFISTRQIEELNGVKQISIQEACLSKLNIDIADADFPKSEEVAEILFSTGTTGKSKGIVLTHRNDVALAENVKYGTQMKPDNVELVPMPLSHSHGLRRIYGNLLNGSSVVIIDGVMFLKKMFNLMDRYQVSAMDLSPALLSIIFKLGKDSLGNYANQLDYIQLGSAPLAEEDKLHLCKLLPRTRLYNFYGSTEAGCSCILDFNSVSGKKGCIGKPTVNAKFIVVDENKKEIVSDSNNLGFLASAGDINMKEYYKAPELTEEALGGMNNGYIYTKDMGYIDSEGYVYMLGRKDDVINYGGVKISPEEIESIIMKNSLIKDCALIPIKDELTGQAPKLFVSLYNSAEFDMKEFKEFLIKEVDTNKQPKIIEIIEEIPRTFNGKIIRKKLIGMQ